MHADMALLIKLMQTPFAVCLQLMHDQGSNLLIGQQHLRTSPLLSQLVSQIGHLSLQALKLGHLSLQALKLGHLSLQALKLLQQFCCAVVKSPCTNSRVLPCSACKETIRVKQVFRRATQVSYRTDYLPTFSHLASIELPFTQVSHSPALFSKQLHPF